MTKEYEDHQTKTPLNKSELKDLLCDIRPLLDEYSEWNCWDRTDGLIIHTDAIADFIEWMKEKIENTK
jgi:hypothetical protein